MLLAPKEKQEFEFNERWKTVCKISRQPFGVPFSKNEKGFFWRINNGIYEHGYLGYDRRKMSGFLINKEHLWCLDEYGKNAFCDELNQYRMKFVYRFLEAIKDDISSLLEQFETMYVPNRMIKKMKAKIKENMK